MARRKALDGKAGAKVSKLDRMLKTFDPSNIEQAQRVQQTFRNAVSCLTSSAVRDHLSAENLSRLDQALAVANKAR